MMLNGRTFLIFSWDAGWFSPRIPCYVPSKRRHRADAAQQQAQPASPIRSGTGPAATASAPTRNAIESQKALRQELKGTYKTWLNQEVPYIITDEERKAFMNLSNDEERDAFIENFWLRRNPNPDSPENEFREEHYRRIAYANEHFAAGKPGWKTDRGRIYIMPGASPMRSTRIPPAAATSGPWTKAAAQTSTFPFEVWHYRYLEGIGENIELEFVDTCQCGDYHFTIDPAREGCPAAHSRPGPYPVRGDGQGQEDRHAPMGMSPGTGPGSNQAKEFDSIELAAKLFAPPPIKFEDLNAFVSEHKLLTGPIFPFDVRTDFIKVTESMDLVPITMQIKNRDITFMTKDGVSKGVVNILGKVTTITDKTVQTFEDTVEVEQPAELLEKTLDQQIGLLEGSAAGARTLPPGYRHQGCEQSRSHGHLRARP